MKTSQDNIELFPYESFGVRLDHKDEKKICWFKDDYDLQKYLERYKLDKRTIRIDYRDGEPVKSSKKQQGSIQKRPGKNSNRSSGTSKGRTTRVDSTSNSSGITKRKKK